MSTFPLGRLQVRRSGYGAMQLAGPFAFGLPPDRATAIGVLRAAVAAGVNHIDTAQYYGPDVVNDLIRDALYPYPDGLAIVSKVAVRRDDRGAVLPFDDPDQLREGIEDNLRSLRAGQLAAVNLRLPGDGRVGARFDDQLAAMVAARDEGLIAGIGLSNISLEQLRHAVAGTEIVCVQNLFHVADHQAAPLLEECLSCGIAFVPFCPLGWPRGRENPVLTSPVVNQTAARPGITPAQVALQWLLQLAPNVLLIPGTGSVAHLRENLAAEGAALDEESLRQLDAIAPWPDDPPRAVRTMTALQDSVHGRIAVVTGGAGAIGTAITRALQAAGHQTVVLDRDGDVVCDLSSETSTRAAAAEVLERYGRCDVFVHCAAAFDQVTITDVDAATWRHVQAVNVESALWLVQAFTPGMAQRRFGRIIFITSDTFWAPPTPVLLAYVASKGALLGVMRTLAVTLGADGIAVSAVAPGLTDTPAARLVNTDEQFDATVERQAIKRRLTPDDTVAAVAYLASAGAAAMTGQVLCAYGGLIMR